MAPLSISQPIVQVSVVHQIGEGQALQAERAHAARRKRRHRDGADIPLTIEDADVFLRISGCLEHQYRIADRTDAETTRHRLQFGGVALAVTKAVRS